MYFSLFTVDSKRTSTPQPDLFAAWDDAFDPNVDSDDEASLSELCTPEGIAKATIKKLETQLNRKTAESRKVDKELKMLEQQLADIQKTYYRESKEYRILEKRYAEMQVHYRAALKDIANYQEGTLAYLEKHTHKE